MTLSGQVHNGVIVLESGQPLPEGAKVTVAFDIEPVPHKSAHREPVTFPLVRSLHPGDLHLTGDRIAEILDEEDAPPQR